MNIATQELAFTLNGKYIYLLIRGDHGWARRSALSSSLGWLAVEKNKVLDSSSPT